MMAKGPLSGVLDPSVMPMWDFVHSAWMSVAFFVLRWVSEKLLTPPLTRLLAWLRPGAEKSVKHVYDDFFIAFCSVGLEAFAVYVTLGKNYGCLPWSTDPCLVGWPDHAHNTSQRWFFITIAAYNVYEFICTGTGFGTVLTREMIVHHLITLMLVFLSYAVNLLRYGIMWIALFDMSNPLLHGAKMFNTVDAKCLQDAKWITFLTFAIVFFVGRIAATPFSILRPAFMQSFGILPLSYALTFVGLMLMIYCLQCFWFYKIVLIITGSGGKSKKKNAKNAEKAE